MKLHEYASMLCTLHECSNMLTPDEKAFVAEKHKDFESTDTMVVTGEDKDRMQEIMSNYNRRWNE